MNSNRRRTLVAAQLTPNERNEMKARLLLILGSAAYVAAVTWSYIHLVSPDFAYLGYIYRHPQGGYNSNN